MKPTQGSTVQEENSRDVEVFIHYNSKQKIFGDSRNGWDWWGEAS
jgi:hypothetical protein